MHEEKLQVIKDTLNQVRDKITRSCSAAIGITGWARQYTIENYLPGCDNKQNSDYVTAVNRVAERRQFNIFATDTIEGFIKKMEEHKYGDCSMQSIYLIYHLSKNGIWGELCAVGSNHVVVQVNIDGCTYLADPWSHFDVMSKQDAYLKYGKATKLNGNIHPEFLRMIKKEISPINAYAIFLHKNDQWFGRYTLDVVEKTVVRFGHDKINIQIAWMENQKSTSKEKTKNPTKASKFDFGAIFGTNKRKNNETQNETSSKGNSL